MRSPDKLNVRSNHWSLAIISDIFQHCKNRAETPNYREMSSVAEHLRHNREKQGLSIHQIAEATRIRADYLQALEEGNYDVFAAAVYIRGFVRTYATLLHLEVPVVMRELELELAQTRHAAAYPILTAASPTTVDWVTLRLSKINWIIVLLVSTGVILLVAFVLAYRAWRSHRSADPLAKLGPGLYQSAQSNSGELLPLPVAKP